MNVNSEKAYEFIRKRILSGEYPPGHSLMTEHLSEEIGVSRTPVREAFHELRAEGLVTIQPRLGASVKKMDEKEFRELCDLRLALEVHAAGLAAQRRSEVDLHAMKFALDAIRDLTGQIIAAPHEKPLLSELVQVDIRFHIAIMTAAHNDLMKSEILRIHLLHRVVNTRPNFGEDASGGLSEEQIGAHRRASLASHEAIFAAIERQDALAAKAAMEWHIQDGIQKILGERARTQIGELTRELTPDELAYVG